ncbi:MAG: hypothetical protein KBA17_03135 [Aliarcobacter sp.]|nr:hypothetical protein [Aliarcobacter sp.]
MNIYIYGNHSFKKDIHETLEHSNIKFKMDNDCVIKEINDLSVLKQTIKNNPYDVYLIDDEKIIKKNSLQKKIKFLTPKDAIEEEFLLDSGIADLSVNSLSEIPKYIIRKYEDQKKTNEQEKVSIFDDVDSTADKDNNVELDEELAKLLAKEDEVHEEQINIPTDNYLESENLEDLFNISDDINFQQSSSNDNISKNEFDDIMNFNDDFGLNNISFDYDDEATNNEPLDPMEEDFFKSISMDKEENDEEEDDENEIFEDIDFLEEIFTNKEKNKQEKEEKVNENKIFNESLQREKSMNDDEFFELDSLNEKDLLEALSYNGDNVSNMNHTDLKTNILENSSNTISVNSSSNVDELAQLISKLLNNKTLEITIKIKD